MSYPAIISGIENDKDIIVIVLSASRVTDDDERLPITDAQKEAAMFGAKAVLQNIGAEVNENSTALIIPAQNVASKLTVNCTIEPIEE